jgi:hypothetical protein
MPGEGWSMSGPVGVTSGGGALGSTGWDEGMGLSVGGWVAIETISFAPINALWRAELPRRLLIAAPLV